MGEESKPHRRRASNITKSVVESLRPGEIAWDNRVAGFGVRRQRASKVYVLKTRVRGRQRWFTIGRHGSPWTVDKAREKAKSILGEIADKKDPAALRDADRNSITVGALAEMFLQQHVDAKRRPSTARTYRDALKRLVRPSLGTLRVFEVTRADVARLHHSLRTTPYQANRMLAALSSMFSWAERRGYRDERTNPCRGIDKFPEAARERFLSNAELARLGEALAEAERNEAETQFVVAAIRLLLFTGCRLSEILTLQWDHVDLDRATLRLPESKTGAKVVYLPAPALEILASLPRQAGTPFVIAGARPGEHLVDLQRPWRRIRTRAGLEGVRLHDIRHSYASVAAAGGLSLPMIGKLLGHSSVVTTERYAHLGQDPVREAGNLIAERIAAALRGEPGEVVPLERRARGQ